MEKESEKLKMGLDAQESFAQMHEDRNMNKGIGGQMMQLDPVVAQESRKERRTRNSNPRSKKEVKAMISPVFSYG